MHYLTLWLGICQHNRFWVIFVLVYHFVVFLEYSCSVAKLLKRILYAYQCVSNTINPLSLTVLKIYNKFSIILFFFVKILEVVLIMSCTFILHISLLGFRKEKMVTLTIIYQLACKNSF